MEHIPAFLFHFVWKQFWHKKPRGIIKLKGPTKTGMIKLIRKFSEFSWFVRKDQTRGCDSRSRCSPFECDQQHTTRWPICWRQFMGNCRKLFILHTEISLVRVSIWFIKREIWKEREMIMECFLLRDRYFQGGLCLRGCSCLSQKTLAR